MTTEQLLVPRRRVVVKYPDSPYKVGDVLICSNGTSWYDEFPEVFKEIFWWEERDERDMPEYVKTFYDYGDKIPYQYFKIERWDMGNVRGIINKINRKVITLNGLVKPCSEQEYLNYINKTNENK